MYIRMYVHQVVLAVLIIETATHGVAGMDTSLELLTASIQEMEGQTYSDMDQLPTYLRTFIKEHKIDVALRMWLSARYKRAQVMDPVGQVDGAEVINPVDQADGADVVNPTGQVDVAEDVNPTSQVDGAEVVNPNGLVDATEVMNPTAQVHGAEVVILTGLVDGAETMNPVGQADGAEAMNPVGQANVVEVMDPTGKVDGAEVMNSTVLVDGTEAMNSTAQVDGTADVVNPTGQVDGAEAMNSVGQADGAEVVNPIAQVSVAEAMNQVGQADGAEVVNPTGQADDAEIVNPTGLVDATELMNSTGLVDGAETMNPVGQADGAEAMNTVSLANGAEVINPTGQVDGAEVINPTGQVDGAEVMNSTGLVDGTEVKNSTAQVDGTADVVNPTGQIDGAEAMNLIGQADGAEVVNPVAQVSVAKAMNPVGQADGAEVVNPTGQVDGAAVVNPTGQVDGAKVVNPNSLVKTTEVMNSTAKVNGVEVVNSTGLGLVDGAEALNPVGQDDGAEAMNSVGQAGGAEVENPTGLVDGTEVMNSIAHVDGAEVANPTAQVDVAVAMNPVGQADGAEVANLTGHFHDAEVVNPTGLVDATEVVNSTAQGDVAVVLNPTGLVDGAEAMNPVGQADGDEAMNPVGQVDGAKAVNPTGLVDGTEVMNSTAQTPYSTSLIDWIHQEVGVMCSACYVALDTAFDLMRNGVPEQKMAKMFITVCKLGSDYTSEVCTGLLSDAMPQIYGVVTNSNVTGETACHYLLVDECGGPPSSWTVSFPDRPKPEVRDKVLPNPQDVRTMKILQLPDTHVQFSYEVDAIVDCDEPLCCMANSSNKEPNLRSLAGFWGTGEGPCDIPMRTFESMLAHIAETEQDIDLIYLTGDGPPHDIWRQTKESVEDAMNRTFSMIRSYFPKTHILPALGNHDTNPVNEIPQPFVQGDYSISWLFDVLDAQWRAFQPDLNSSTIRYGAYYSIVVKNGTLKVISLNTVYCYKLNWWLLLSPVDPAQQLSWLVDELQQSENIGQSVHIIGHVPPGSLDCMPNWSGAFGKIVKRYEGTIAAQFYGHTHNDQFEIFYDFDIDWPINIAFIAPSVTTYPALNPAFRLYTVDAEKTLCVLNTETWVLNMTDANLYNKTQWYRLYSAQDDVLNNESFPTMSPKHMYNYARALYEDDDLFHQFVRYFYKDDDKSVKQGCTGKCREDMLCFNLRSDSSNPSLCHVSV